MDGVRQECSKGRNKLGTNVTQAGSISWVSRDSEFPLALCQGTTLVVPQDQQNKRALAPEG